jgi:hypothetical protein
MDLRAPHRQDKKISVVRRGLPGGSSGVEMWVCRSSAVEQRGKSEELMREDKF